MCYTTLFISLHKDILDMDIETVDKFLKEFKDKARVFGIIFRIDRKEEYASFCWFGDFGNYAKKNNVFDS